MPLTASELEFYRRQMALREVGREGQEKLKRASVLCIGAGGLGSPALIYLASMGVGRIGIVDGDSVERSNLSRQIVHRPFEVGLPKVQSAVRRLSDIQPWCHFDPISEYLNEQNVEKIIEPYDIILDGTDNFIARYLLNDACVRKQKPLVSAAVFQWEGQLSVFNWKNGPCYRCLFPVAGAVASCSEMGVMGAVPGVLGTLQAMEVIKMILGIGNVLSGEVLQIDLLDSRFRKFSFSKEPKCGCATGHFDSPSPSCEVIKWIEPLDVKETAKILDVRSEEEFRTGHIPGSRSLPLPEILNGDLPSEILEARELILVCAGEMRAKQAFYRMGEAIPSLKVLRGGIKKWMECGRAIA